MDTFLQEMVSKKIVSLDCYEFLCIPKLGFNIPMSEMDKIKHNSHSTITFFLREMDYALREN